MASDLSGHPVIIGSGLTGTAVSRMLSRAGVSHTLIGGPPNALPRLGESLNLEGTLDLLRLFPEHAAYFYGKKVVVGYVDDFVFSCDFAIDTSRAARLLFRLLGHQAPREFLQFDRLGFDDALYADAAASDYCTALDTKVTALDYDAAIDRFASLQLADDRILPASYVFDSTNHGRLVGTAAGVGCQYLGDVQRVAYTHFRRPEPAAPSTHGVFPWDYSTSIVRLYRELDEIDGIAWYIPLGSYVSVGISVSQETTTATDDELLHQAVAAFARRGLPFLDRYPERAPTMGLTHRYFVHHRAYGANWLLAGPAFAQVWWMAGAGVGTSLMAAQIAPHILDEPSRVGQRYQDYMLELIGIHDTFEWFAASNRSSLSAAGILRYSDRFVRTNLRRLARSTDLCGGRRARLAGRALYRVFQSESSVKNYCSVHRETLPRQTARIFGASAETHADSTTVPERTAEVAMSEDNTEVVRRLLDVLAGKTPVSQGALLIDRNVVSHLDGYTAHGIAAWAKWLSFIRSRSRVSQLDLTCDRITVNADQTITPYGRWVANRNGTRVVSDEVSATYRIENGKVVEIWTTRTNYLLIFGPMMRYRLGCLLVLLRSMAWSRTADEGRKWNRFFADDAGNEVVPA